jgi:hypothetical protein
MPNLKLYQIEYGYFPSNPEKSIVIAENETDAFNITKNLYANLVLVNTKPEDMSCSEHPTLECQITEIPMEKGIVYTGHFCC